MHRLTATWLLPITAPPIRDGAVLVGADGRILALGRDEDVPRPPEARAVDLGEAALLPGLVNTHTHPELTAYRGLLEDLAFPDWIAALMRARRAEPEGAAELAARWACAEALAAGVTTMAATEKSGASARALARAHMRGIVYHEVFGPDPGMAGQAMADLRGRVDAARREASALVRIGVSPHAPYSVSDQLFSATADYARDAGLPIAVHTAESEDERRFVTAAEGTFAERHRASGYAVHVRGRSTIDLLHRTGVLDARPLLVHCVDVSAEDADRIASAGATVAHCPAANARLGHGIAPIDLLLDRGIAVGLGSDSVASNNRIDMLEEARLAQLFQRARLRDPVVLDASHVLEMATLGGARALGLDGVIGALEPGLDADLCAVSLAGVHVRPVHEPAAAVVLAARASDVVLTMVRGRILHGAGLDARAPIDSLRTGLDAIAVRLRSALRA